MRRGAGLLFRRSRSAAHAAGSLAVAAGRLRARRYHLRLADSEELEPESDHAEGIVGAELLVYEGDEIVELGHDPDRTEHEVGADAPVEREVGLGSVVLEVVLEVGVL